MSSADGVCETGCRNLVVPSTECSTAFNALLTIFHSGITQALNPDTVDCNRDTAARFLEQFCTRECFSTLPPFYTCTIRVARYVGMARKQNGGYNASILCA